MTILRNLITRIFSAKHSKEIAWAYISKAISLGGGVAILLFLPNLLGAEEYGRFSLVLSYIAVLGILFANSINGSIKTDLSHRGFSTHSFIVFSEALKLKLLLFGTTTVVFLGIIPYLNIEVLQEYSLLFLFLLFAMNFWGLVIAAFEALHRLFFITIMYILEYTIKIGGILLLFIYSNVTFENVLTIFIFSYIIALCVGLYILKHIFQISLSWSLLFFKLSIDRNILTRTFYYTFTGASFVILARTDIIMIGEMLSEEKAGIYGLASDYAKKATLLSIPIVHGVIPLFAKTQNISQLFLQYAKRISKINIGIFFFILIAAFPFIHLVYGEEYTSSTYVLMLLGMFPLLSVLQNFTQQILMTLNAAKETFLAANITTVINIIFNFLGIYSLGIYGAAIATLIAYVVWVSINYFSLRRFFNESGN